MSFNIKWSELTHTCAHTRTSLTILVFILSMSSITAVLFYNLDDVIRSICRVKSTSTRLLIYKACATLSNHSISYIRINYIINMTIYSWINLCASSSR